MVNEIAVDLNKSVTTIRKLYRNTIIETIAFLCIYLLQFLKQLNLKRING
jgi:hypothetical protein